MAISKNILFQIINILVILHIINAQLSSIEYTCLVGVTEKYLSPNNIPREPGTGNYLFCSSLETIILNCGDNRNMVKSLTIKPLSTIPFDPKDINCLPNVESITIYNPYGASVADILSYTLYTSSTLSTFIFENIDSTISGSALKLAKPYRALSTLSISIDQQTTPLDIKFSMLTAQSVIIKSNKNTTESFPITYTNDLTALNTYFKFQIAATTFPNLKNIITYSGVEHVAVTMVSGYNKTSLNDNIKTITNQYRASVYGVEGDISPFPTNIKSVVSKNLNQLDFYMNFETPSSIIDISTPTTNAPLLKKLAFYNVSKGFSFNGGIPLKFRSDLETFSFSNGAITNFNIRNFYSSYKYLKWLHFNYNGWEGPLGTWDKNFVSQDIGHYVDIDVSNNRITGTVDESFCNVLTLNVKNNLLTGEIPTCFTCFFEHATLKAAFSLNSFSNFDNPPPCTTIIPNIVRDAAQSDSSRSWFWVFGKDLMVAYSYPQIIDPSTGTKYSINTLQGNLFWFIIDTMVNSVAVPLPTTLELSFPSYSKIGKFTLSPLPTPPKLEYASTDVFGKSFTFNGAFMTYNISTISIQVNGQDCVPTGSPTFNIMYCSVSQAITSTAIQIVVAKIGTVASQITMQVRTMNDLISCSSDCGYFKGNGYCNSQVGQCVCNQGFQGSDCSLPFKECPMAPNSMVCNNQPCNNQTGVCICDSTHQGSDCTLPYVACPIYGGKACNNAGTCNTQTGVCTCDSTHQGTDCSLPFKVCPIYGGQTCNNAGTCNTQTGVCSCDSTHQGTDCSLPFKACPIYGGQTCNNAGTCNTQTGVCTCDSTHQGSDCSLTYKACPIYASKTCNNAGTCNTQTGVCTCDSTHQGSDCSLPFKACPVYGGKTCNGAGTCNTQTGVCTCDSTHQGSDCSLPFKACPVYGGKACNNAGTCNTQTGVCTCDSTHQGTDCSLPFKACPVYGGQTCNNAGTCNTQTGLCTCDSTHQGTDCSLPFKACPVYGGQTCNNAGTCNTQTGVCTCDSIHQGTDCSLPFKACPIYSGQTCNNAGACNTQTGVCTCDSNHQGTDCSLPFKACPTYASKTCNNAGTCNDQIGVCTCDSSHQGSDCSLPYIECPSFNGVSCNNAGFCNDTVGICNCNSQYTGNDCSGIKCPNDCSNLGKCLNSTGICQCDDAYSKSKDCSPIQCDDPKCNSNGVCNQSIGECQCSVNPYSWGGKNCDIPLHYISSIDPSFESGGNATFYGWFGDMHEGLNISIHLPTGDQKCYPILKVSNSSIQCVAPPGKGEHQVSIIQNSQYWNSTKVLYRYLKSNLECPNNCTNSNQGQCDSLSGFCTCFNKYGGSDCNGLGVGGKDSSSSSSSTTNQLPQTETRVDDNTGSATISNEKTNYELYIESLIEVDVLGVPVKTHPLEKNWIKLNQNSTIQLFHVFTQTIQEQCTINYTIEEIQGGDKEFSFAGKDFMVSDGSVKMSIGIYNYKYTSNLNTLQLLMKSSVKTINSNENDKSCNDKDTEIDTINTNDKKSLDIITIKKDSKILYGRFIDRMLSDGKVTAMSTTIISKDNDSITVAMNIPHAQSILIDPDFSVLLSTSFKSSCPSKSNKTWLLPVSISLPLVGCAVIASISYYVIKKKKESQFAKKIKNLSSTQSQ